MRKHRSHSQLNAYLRCGHQYYLQKVQHKPEDPSVWQPAGTAFHTTTEQLDEAIYHFPGSEIDPEYWMDQFTINFDLGLEETRAKEPDESLWRRAGRATKDRPNKEDALWWQTAGREMVAAYVTWRASTVDIWEIATVNGAPGIEVEVTYPLGGVPMKGYVDRVLRSKIDQRLVVVDLKSGSRTPASPMQLATYSVQLEPIVGEPVLWGAWYDARKGALSEPIDLTIWSEGLLGQVYSSLDRGIEAGVFLPNIDTHCSGCGVRKFCIYNGGNENA